MEEDIKEEDIQTTSQVSSMQEDSFVDSSNTQISEIEEQLKKAQDTLMSLQKMKEQLEKERRSKIKAAEAEREMEMSHVLKAENEKLKRELKEYQEEINSLKDVISVFKNDLLQTAEHLQSRVSDSLRKIGQDNHSSRARPSSHTHHHVGVSAHHVATHNEKKPDDSHNSHAGGFFGHLGSNTDGDAKKIEAEKTYKDPVQHVEDNDNIHAVEAKEPASPQINAVQTQQQIVEPVQNIASGTNAPVTEQKVADSTSHEAVAPTPVANNEISASQTDDKANIPEISPAQQAPTPEANTNIEQAVASPAVVEPAAPTEVVSKDQAEEENMLKEMNEYDEIKRELEALENESVFSSEEHIDQITENNQELVESQNVTTGSSGILKGMLGKFTGHKKKAPKVPEAVKAIKVDSQPQDAGEFKQQFWQGGNNNAVSLEQTKAADANNINATISAPAQSEQPSISQATASAPEAINQAEAAPIAQQVIVNPVVENQTPVSAENAAVDNNSDIKNVESNEKSSDQIKKLSTVFKKKKKAIKQSRAHDEEKDHHKEHGKGMSGLGKMAVKAAVVVLILFAGVVAYKIKNADQLRESYMSKAKENVSQAGKASNAPPAGFSDLPVEERYKEAYADVTYENTVWAEYNDSDLGVKLKYPQNATYRVKPIGSNNLWFLRKNGYLLKIERIDTEQTLEEMAVATSANINYKQETLTIKDSPTIHMILQETMPVMGNIYLVKVDSSIFKVWYKTFAPGEAPDDEQRLKTLLDSLEFVRQNQ